MPSNAVYEFCNVLPDGIVVIDAAGQIVHVNPELCAMLDYGAGALIGQHLRVLIPDASRDAHEGYLAAFRGGPVQHKPMLGRAILQALDRRGRSIPVTISLARFPIGEETVVFAILREVAAEVAGFQQRAETDHLTGVANRFALSKRIERMLEDGEPFGLLYLDLNDFKPINDEFGHQTGDAVLKVVVRRIQQSTRESDIVARMGGDEFAVLLAGVDSTETLEPLAAKIREQIAQPIRLGDFECAVDAAIGCARAPADGNREAELMAHADAAMYSAKRGDRGDRRSSG